MRPKFCGYYHEVDVKPRWGNGSSTEYNLVCRENVRYLLTGVLVVPLGPLQIIKCKPLNIHCISPCDKFVYLLEIILKGDIENIHCTFGSLRVRTAHSQPSYQLFTRLNPSFTPNFTFKFLPQSHQRCTHISELSFRIERYRAMPYRSLSAEIDNGSGSKRL